MVESSCRLDNEARGHGDVGELETSAQPAGVTLKSVYSCVWAARWKRDGDLSLGVYICKHTCLSACKCIMCCGGL